MGGGGSYFLLQRLWLLLQRLWPALAAQHMRPHGLHPSRPSSVCWQLEPHVVHREVFTCALWFHAASQVPLNARMYTTPPQPQPFQHSSCAADCSWGCGLAGSRCCLQTATHHHTVPCVLSTHAIITAELAALIQTVGPRHRPCSRWGWFARPTRPPRVPALMWSR